MKSARGAAQGKLLRAPLVIPRLPVRRSLSMGLDRAEIDHVPFCAPRPDSRHRAVRWVPSRACRRHALRAAFGTRLSWVAFLSIFFSHGSVFSVPTTIAAPWRGADQLPAPLYPDGDSLDRAAGLLAAAQRPREQAGVLNVWWVHCRNEAKRGV